MAGGSERLHAVEPDQEKWISEANLAVLVCIEMRGVRLRVIDPCVEALMLLIRSANRSR
jgi:hypothetical protein